MQRTLSNFKNIEMENIRSGLNEKFKSTLMQPIPLEEKMNLSNSIKSIRYPYSIKGILVYINKNTAELLAQSMHPTLQKWGKLCAAFYENSQFKNFVVADTGIVTTGYISRSRDSGTVSAAIGGYGCWVADFHGHGVWDLSKHVWIGSSATPFNPSSGLMTWPVSSFSHWLSVLYNPPYTVNPEQSIFGLLTPPHIAALMGDAALLQYLASQEFSLESKLNTWAITPLELAVSSEQLEVVNYLLQKSITQDIDKIQLIVIKHGSMAMIDTFAKYAWLTEDALEAARERDATLFTYLHEMQRMKVDDLLKQHSPLATIQIMLDSPLLPVPLLVNFISLYPDLVIKPLIDDMNTNTLLHLLVNQKAEIKVKKLLEAMFQACYLDIPGYQIDCEIKNKHGLTALDISLSNATNNITSDILLYGNPKNLNVDQQNRLVASQINIGAITREREQRAMKLSQQDHKNLVKVQHALIDNINHTSDLYFELKKTREELDETKEDLKETKEELKKAREEIIFMGNMVMNLYQHLGINIPTTGITPSNNLTNRLSLQDKPEVNYNKFFINRNSDNETHKKEQIQLKDNIKINNI